MKLQESKRIEYANKTECLNLQIFIFKNAKKKKKKKKKKPKKKKEQN